MNSPVRWAWLRAGGMAMVRLKGEFRCLRVCLPCLFLFCCVACSPALAEPPVIPSTEAATHVESEEANPVLSTILWKPPAQSYSRRFNLRVAKKYSPDQSAEYPHQIPLAGALKYAQTQNLAVQIASTNVVIQNWLLAGALGRWAPDADLTYSRVFDQQHRIRTRASSASASFLVPAFRGGDILFGALSTNETRKAAKAEKQATINDTLFAVVQAHCDLLRNQAVLRVRHQALEISTYWYSWFSEHRDWPDAELATLQFKSQMGSDRTAIYAQSFQVRRAAIRLARLLNFFEGINIEGAEAWIAEWQLVPIQTSLDRIIGITDKFGIQTLTHIALSERPEIRQFDNLRRAAVFNIETQAAPLFTSMNFFGSASRDGERLRGNPTAYSLGIELAASFANTGIRDITNTGAAAYVARRAMLQFNQVVLDVIEQVASSFLELEAAKNQVEPASEAAEAAVGQLRNISDRILDKTSRIKAIDILNAERQYVDSMISKIDSLTQVNVAQAQVLRSVGVVKLDQTGSLIPLRDAFRPKK